MFILWLQWCGKRFKCDDGDCPFRGGMIQNHGYNRFSCFSCDFDLCDSCVHRKLFVLTKVVQRQSNHVRSLLCGTLHSGKWRWLQYSLPCYKIRPNHLGACKNGKVEHWNQCDQIGRFLHFGQPLKPVATIILADLPTLLCNFLYRCQNHSLF